ncbi:MAG: hypothetical protein AAFP97_08670 [Pseudomonadota bacterium]
MRIVGHTIRHIIGRAGFGGVLIVMASVFCLPTHAYAQVDRILDAAEREIERRAQREIRDVIRNAGKDDETGRDRDTPIYDTGAGPAPTPHGGPEAPKPVWLTQCDGLRPTRIVYGQLGDYIAQTGMSAQRNTGFVRQREVDFIQGCILPDLRSGEVLYLEYDKQALAAKGDFKTQCVKVNDAGYGAVNDRESADDYPADDSYLRPGHLKLACGHSEGISDCVGGTDADRGQAAERDFRNRGVTPLSFHMMRTHQAATPAPGERLYCHYFNAQSGLSLFGYEYYRERF